VADEPIPEPLGLVPDVMGEALDDGNPDHVRGEDEGTMLAEGEVGGGEQRVERDFLDAVCRIVAACLDLAVEKVVQRLVRLAGWQRLRGPLDLLDGESGLWRPGPRSHRENLLA
jgi:hypothetical protein